MTPKRKLLIVDDEPSIRRILEVAFTKDGFAVSVAEDATEALRLLTSEKADLVITDVTMPGKSGHEFLKQVKERWPELPVVVITAYGTIPQAVQAIRDGAHEYVTKPFDLDVLKKIATSALEAPRNPRSRHRTPNASGGGFIAESEPMRKVLEMVKQVADSRATVLITGESGAGKEVVARSLHELSSRASGPFVAVSCAALPETLLESELFGYEKGAFTGAQGAKPGRFELANRGTLFLDEIGDIPMAIQVKLLRVLQERQFERLGSSSPTRVDVRLITATNRNLHEAVEEHTFRLDLLYRLQVVDIEIPPLRDRREDILPLAKHFLLKFASENERVPLEIGTEAESSLLAYRWPGNVRELENTMERAVVLCPTGERTLRPESLPASITRAA
ncbi:MAG: sigma-54-dependent Fis family transcriptional regulator [Fimbriimonas ginsengisoli]|uniref:Sigma-54-dependent Fis family transcriptional regulator n=1 Tax=Fimbriimonas ginsengisoli TaxID=1005039 RepID=A0A931PVT7_FIMGI|nr:sigma-54-dependent Fis family transcriptional regulator [Fimbriimonas ginsengisoli]